MVMKNQPPVVKSLPLLVALLGLAACRPSSPLPPEPSADVTADTPRPVVFAGSYALASFAERIGRDDFEVVFPVPPDQDPEQWMPDDETIAVLQEADLILLNGAAYENWPDKILLPAGRSLDTSTGFTGQLLEVENAVTHRHGPHGVHSHAGTASIVWLNPKLALQQTLAVEQALAALRPDLADELASRASRLRADLEQIDRDGQDAWASLAEQPLLASHPVYHYLAARYGLELPSVHWEPSETPAAREWQKLDRQLRQRPVTWMIWEDQPTPETAAELERRGIGVIVIDPAFHPPAAGGFLEVMRENIRRIRQAAARADAAP
jgi:zinc transport system substrate-binding protein